jgi:hypothetical protein
MTEETLISIELQIISFSNNILAFEETYHWMTFSKMPSLVAFRHFHGNYSVRFFYSNSLFLVHDRKQNK